MESRKVRLEIISNDLTQKAIKIIVLVLIISVFLLLVYDSQIIIYMVVSEFIVLVALLIVKNYVIRRQKEYLEIDKATIKFTSGSSITDFKLEKISNFRFIYSGYAYQSISYSMAFDTGGMGNFLMFFYNNEEYKFEVRLKKDDICNLNDYFKYWKCKIVVLNESKDIIGMNKIPS